MTCEPEFQRETPLEHPAVGCRTPEAREQTAEGDDLARTTDRPPTRSRACIQTGFQRGAKRCWCVVAHGAASDRSMLALRLRGR